MRARSWPPYFDLSIHPIFFQSAQLLNPFNDSEIAEEVNGLRQHFVFRPPPRVIEMNLRRKDMCVEAEIGQPESNLGVTYAVINPLDDSKAGHQSVDSERFKDIVWPKIVIARRVSHHSQSSLDQSHVSN